MTIDDVIRTVLDLPPQASTFAVSVDRLHAFVFATAVIGSCGIIGIAVSYIARYSRRATAADNVAQKRDGTASTFSEVALVGGVLSLFLFWWALGLHQYSIM